MAEAVLVPTRVTHVVLPLPLRSALVAGAAAAGIARFGATWEGLLMAAVLAVLAVLSIIDLRERRLPNRILLPSAAIALVAHSLILPEYTLEWVVSALLAALALLLPAFINPAGIGMGDVKLMLLLGAVLGADVVDALVFGLVSLVPYTAYLFVRHGRAARRRTIPLGPFLALGAAVVLMLTGPREPQIPIVPQSAVDAGLVAGTR